MEEAPESPPVNPREAPLSQTSWKEYGIPLVLGSVSLVLIGASVILLIKSTQTASPIQFSHSQDTASAGEGAPVISIDIEGAVKNPGVYQLPVESRVEDALAKAGGLSAEADLERIAKTINRAGKLSDGAKLYIPQKGDPTATSGQGFLPPSSRTSNVSSLSNLVSVNSASQQELEGLSGIGPVTAKKIIDNRPYQSLGELVTKKAVSRSLFEKLKEQLTL